MARKRKKFSSAKAARRRSRKRKSTILARAKKEFTYMGHTTPELKEMPISEFAALVPSRVRRSIERGWTHGQEKLYNDIKAGNRKVYKTHERDTVVLPLMIDTTIGVHNGKEFREVTIQPEMVGHFLGEFALTRTEVKHTGPGVGATRSSKYLPLK
ncbi:MAG: 30S ribosomal protein S19 [Thermoplasmata archaeon]|jgi:small subunit ribosomal protein S19|nr:30S ribosomal protein S19 [Thermoplasmata archaeon]